MKQWVKKHIPNLAGLGMFGLNAGVATMYLYKFGKALIFDNGELAMAYLLVSMFWIMLCLVMWNDRRSYKAMFFWMKEAHKYRAFFEMARKIMEENNIHIDIKVSEECPIFPDTFANPLDPRDEKLPKYNKKDIDDALKTIIKQEEEGGSK